MHRKVIGRLLRAANANPHIFGKHRFYPLKNRVISRFGEKVGHDLQYIKKQCWSCNGTGIFTGYDNGIHWIECPAQPCYRCVHGTYTRYWVLLERYDLAGCIFHRPVERIYHTSRLPEKTVSQITGYIKHASVPPAKSGESFLWLAMLFQPSLLFLVMGTTTIKDPFQTFPVLVLVNNIVAWIRNGITKMQHWMRKNWPPKTSPHNFDADELPF